jgi:hypothetical protein
MKKIYLLLLIVLFISCIAASECSNFEFDKDLEGLILDKLTCSENETQTCHCLDGSEGVQLCESNSDSDSEGAAWQACICKPVCRPTVEQCDGVDNDCDGATDEIGATGGTNWYADQDNDGYGDPNNYWIACTAPQGFVDNDSDLDDSCNTCWDPCEDICGDNIDNDCDGLTDYNCPP